MSWARNREVLGSSPCSSTVFHFCGPTLLTSAVPPSGGLPASPQHAVLPSWGLQTSVREGEAKPHANSSKR
uniref:Uncharacterized protein n=1 Tax=Anguilla anguilla TaxID=7936 RepID=A0A0E9SYG7_ANGAN